MVRPLDDEKRQRLLERCLAITAARGSLSLSLDELAREAGTTKRMLVHYFRSRDMLERAIIALLEERLREQFARSPQPAAAPIASPVLALWDQVTAPGMEGVLRLVLEVTRRAWSGDDDAKRFLDGQQQAWVALLSAHLPDTDAVTCVLHLFQGALLDYAVSGDAARGRRSVVRLLASLEEHQPTRGIQERGRKREL